MITSHSVKWILAGALIMPGLTGCSFFGGGDESEEVATSDDTLEATPEGAEEGMPAENMENAEALGAESNALGMEGMEGMDSNALNNAAIAEGAGGGLPGSEIPPELLANDPTAAANAMGMDMGSESMAPPAAAPAGEFSAAPGDVRVYYVSSSATLRSSPDASGQSVGSLLKGDPVLVKVEGNWANVVNRGWVELASLSMSPVGRGKPTKTWN